MAKVKIVAVDPEILALQRRSPPKGLPRYVKSAGGQNFYGKQSGALITSGVVAPTAVPPTPPPTPQSATFKLPPYPRAAKEKEEADSPSRRLVHGKKPKRVLIHDDAPGSRLYDFGDGTTALEDHSGRFSDILPHHVKKFEAVGWTVGTDKHKKAK